MRISGRKATDSQAQLHVQFGQEADPNVKPHTSIYTKGSSALLATRRQEGGRVDKIPRPNAFSRRKSADASYATRIASTSPPPPPTPPPPPAHVLAAARRNLQSPEHILHKSDSRRRVTARQNVATKDGPLSPVLGSNVLLAPGGPFWQLVQDTNENQKRLVQKRIASTNRRRDLASQLPLYLAAHHALMDVIKRLLPEIARSDVSEELKSSFAQAWNKSQDLAEIIEDRQELFQAEEDDELLRMEGKSVAHHAKLSKYIMDLFPQLSLDKDAHFSESISETIIPPPSRAPSLSSTSSGSTVTIRQRYLKTIGTMNLLRDRMFNLDSELQLQLRSREIARDSGRAVGVSDQQFYANFRRRRRKIVDEYLATKAEMAHTYQSCIKEGVEVDPPNLPPYLDQVFMGNKKEYETPHGAEDDAHGLSESSVNIVRWTQHVQRMSQPENDLWTQLKMTDKEAEELLVFPQYQLLQASTDMDRPVASSSKSRSLQQSPSSFGDMPTAGRRYSAPMILQETDRNEDTPALDYQDASTRRLLSKRREARLFPRRANSDC